MNVKSILCALVFGVQTMVTGQVFAESVENKALWDALKHPNRLARDVERDAQRRPDLVIPFLGIEPHMHVLDVLAGGGYYTEIFARYLTQNGQVVMHNNGAYLPYREEELSERFGNGRLKNVEKIIVEIPELKFEEGRFDAIFFGLGFHDTYYTSQNWPAINRDKFFKTLATALKPGGILGITDHRSARNADPEHSGQILHRIDTKVVIRDLEKAGFRLVSESDALSSKDDDYTLSIFNPKVRGKTDRFVLKFIKPN